MQINRIKYTQKNNNLKQIPSRKKRSNVQTHSGLYHSQTLLDYNLSDNLPLKKHAKFKTNPQITQKPHPPPSFAKMAHTRFITNLPISPPKPRKPNRHPHLRSHSPARLNRPGDFSLDSQSLDKAARKSRSLRGRASAPSAPGNRVGSGGGPAGNEPRPRARQMGRRWRRNDAASGVRAAR